MADMVLLDSFYQRVNRYLATGPPGDHYGQFSLERHESLDHQATSQFGEPGFNIGRAVQLAVAFAVVAVAPGLEDERPGVPGGEDGYIFRRFHCCKSRNG